MTNPTKYMINYFFFNYNLRIIQEYFQAKISILRMLSLGRETDTLLIYKRKRVHAFPVTQKCQ